jgi:hypothetical protein
VSKPAALKLREAFALVLCQKATVFELTSRILSLLIWISIGEIRYSSQQILMLCHPLREENHAGHANARTDQMDSKLVHGLGVPDAASICPIGQQR